MGETMANTTIRAIRDLHHEIGEWPTLQEIADELGADRDATRQCLAGLRERHVMRDRRKAGTRRWMPWSET